MYSKFFIYQYVVLTSYKYLCNVYKCLHNIGRHTIRFAQGQNSRPLRVALESCIGTTKQRIKYSSSKEFNKLEQFIKSCSTYIIGHYNPSVRVIDLLSHNTYVVCINFIHKWRDLQFNVDSER